MVPHRIVHNAPVLLEMKYNSYMKVCEGLLCMLGYQKGRQGKCFCFVGTYIQLNCNEGDMCLSRGGIETYNMRYQRTVFIQFTKIGNS